MAKAKTKTTKPSKSKPTPKRANRSKSAAPAEQMTSQPDLLSTLRSVKNRQRDMDEARGSMGSIVKLAIDKKHLHKKAFALYRSLERLPDSRLGPTIRHLLHYIEVGGLRDRAEQQLEFSVLDAEQPAPKAKKAKTKPVEEEPETETSISVPAQMDLSERPDLSLN